MSDAPTKKPGILRRAFFVLKFLEIRLRFILILVITALLVGYWDTIQNYYERWQRERTSQGVALEEKSAESEFEYYCGMHPFVVRDRPGKCPICGMDLTQRKKGAPVEMPEGVLARVQVSPDRIMQAGVQVEPVLYRMLTREVRSYGVVEVAETRVADVIARFPGRVEELMVNATGMPIRKGEPLARIYSPQFLQGSSEYVHALENKKSVENNPNADDRAKERAEALVTAARKRLSLAGFTDQQLDAIAQTGGEASAITLYSPVTGTVMKKNVVLGQNVEEGTALFGIADLSTLWVQVQVIESDIGGIHDRMPVEVSSVAWPGEIFYGTVDFFYPEVDPSSRSLKVRVSIANTDGKLRPGMYVNAVMRSPIGKYGSADDATEKAQVPKKEAKSVSLPTTTAEQAAQYLATLADGAKYFTCTMDPQVVSDKPGDCSICGMHLVEKQKGAHAITLPTTTAEQAAQYLATLADGAKYFTCTMDPQVVSDKPGDCSICGMRLVEQKKGAGVQTASAPGMTTGVGENPALPHAGSYEPVVEGYMCPMHPEEISDKPGVCTTCGCGMKMTRFRIERVLAVPESAVIDTGEHTVVYVESSPGLYDARHVTLGPRAGAYYPVLDGLALGQRIVSRGSFLIDAEARLNPAVSGIQTPSSDQKASQETPQAGMDDTMQATGHQH
ncbi:MAG: efflux RND transporter periplasmic adaptor subunit [Candidatus Hydrogenedentes bacterium]|nr:efflux RND transporter periplasmic adaptor subunit [Candidatus Hydrogenedentota bacterium]